jgi:hypothetical protein
MHHIETAPRTLLGPDGMPSSSQSLQEASDTFFVHRAKLSLPGKLGEWALVDHPVVDRPSDDPTLLENKFFPADLENRPYAEHAFIRKVGNLREIIGTINGTVKRYDLAKYPALTIIMPHVVMQDAATLPILMGQSTLGEGRTIEDNYIIVSRLIPYIDYINPVRRGLGRLPFVRTTQPINAFNQLVRPVGNIAQIFPETESTQPLFNTHKKEIISHNTRSIGAMNNYLRSRASVAQQVQKYISPSASRTKKEGKRSRAKYAQEYVSESTMKMLHKDHRKGIPVWPIGINYWPVAIYTPGFPSQTIKLHSVEPIMPRDNPLSIEEFEKQVLSGLLKSALAVVDRPVFQKPRPDKPSR